MHIAPNKDQFSSVAELSDCKNMDTPPASGGRKPVGTARTESGDNPFHPPRQFERRTINLNNEGLLRRRAMERIEITVIYMERHLSERLQAPELAKMAKLSQAHFFLLFKRATGRSPIAFFIRLRMKRACELLKHTTLFVKQVAVSVGYLDCQFFLRTFKLVNGVTPSEYRLMVTKPLTLKNKMSPAPSIGEVPAGVSSQLVSVAKRTGTGNLSAGVPTITDGMPATGTDVVLASPTKPI